MTDDISRILVAARMLNLGNLASGKIKLKEKKGVSNLAFLAEVLTTECDMRKKKAAMTRRKASNLPDLTFDKNRVEDVIKKQVTKLEELEWISEDKNLIIIGECETGKTTLAAHLGKLAIEAGEKVSYITISKFLEILAKKKTAEAYERKYKTIAQASVTIIDDMMYTRIPDDDLYRLYYAITEINQSQSIVIITNRTLSRWTDGVDDKHMVETLISRLTANSQLVRLDLEEDAQPEKKSKSKQKAKSKKTK